MITIRTRKVFGISEPKPLKGFPPGKVRIKMRKSDFTLIRVKTPDGIREFLVKEEDGFWMPAFETGRNNRLDTQ